VGLVVAVRDLEWRIHETPDGFETLCGALVLLTWAQEPLATIGRTWFRGWKCHLCDLQVAALPAWARVVR
jgi:hypothetical protein